MAQYLGPHDPSNGDSFWMILKQGGDIPRKRHTSYESACTEAQRLATNHPGEKFYVLRAMDAFESRSIVRTKLMDPVPF